MTKSTLGKKLLAIVMTTVLLASFLLHPAFLNLGSIKASAAVQPVDYIAGKYEGVGAGHVFESVTYERLVRLLRTDGNHIVVLSSPGNATSQAALKYINEVAKAYGVQKIYHFDPHLAEGTGINGADITQKDFPYGALWTTLKTYTNQGALLKYIDEDYTSADTDLIVYNRKGAGAEVVDSADTIRSELRIKAEDVGGITGDAAALKAQVENVFHAVGSKGSTNESRLTNYDFFKQGFASANPTLDASIAKAGGTAADFPAVAVTYSELLYLLDQPGTHNVLVSGTWCPDSRAAIPYIVENSIKYSKGTPVYVFDFRIDGRQSNGLSIASGESETAYTGLGYINQLIYDKLGEFNVGYANTVRKYYPNGDKTQSLTNTTHPNYRSPLLIQYNKDAKDSSGNPHPVVKEWLHQVAEYEKPWNDDAKDYPVGSYVDYELATGALNNTQKALGRAKIAAFFDAPEIPSGHTEVIRVNENPGNEDSGCGDDNDPLDNIGENVLIPNHGTYTYDVKNYDINIEFSPVDLSSRQAFTGKTVITAVAAEKLNEISLDFRQQALTADPTVKKVTIGADGTVTEGESVAVSNVERINSDDQDKQKLNLELSSALEKDQAFQVAVAYTTGLVDTFVGNGESPQGFAKSLYGTGAAAIGEPFGATYWFPANNAPHDGATYRVTLVAPSDYASVSAGKEVSDTINSPANGKRTRVYEVTQQTAPYQLFASFNKDSDYSKLTQTITLLDGTEIPAVSYYPSALYAQNTNRARDKIDTLYNKTAYIIRELEKIAGKYPGTSAGFVFDNLSNGSGEPATWGAVETQNRPFFTSTNVTSEATFVHEYTHQWFGDAVRIADWKSLWLNEGFATYVTDLYYENTKGFDTQEKYKKLYNDAQTTSQLWKVAPADIQKETDLFGGAAVAYNRGALALSVLRELVGDEDFFKILKGWVEAFNGKAATTSDFITFAEKTADVDLTGYADEWLYGTAKPASFPTEQLPKLSYHIALSQSGTLTFLAATAGYPAQKAHTVQVNNTGAKETGALTIALSGSDSTGFTLSKTSLGSIAVDGSDSFTVAPKTGLAAGTYTATVTVSGNNGISESFPVSFTVSAKTYGVALSQSGKHTFPAAKVGYAAQQAYSVAVNNTGNQETGALTVALSGAGSTGFTLSKTSLGSIAAGGSGSFTVAPKTGLAAGTHTATVTVSGSNGISDSFDVSFTVNAESEAPSYGISLQSDTHTFPAATVGYAAQQAYSVAVNNTGNQETGALTVALSGTGSKSFTLSKTSLGSITAGGSDSFTVAPKTGLAAGTYTATVTVSGDHGISDSFPVSFTVKAASGKADKKYSVLSSFAAFTGSGDATVRIDADAVKFVRLLHDGRVVDPQNYAVRNGSTIITLKELYLKTLENGTHNFVAEFTDGTAALALTVNVPSETNDNGTVESPQTGENSQSALWILLCSAFLLAAGVLAFLRKRRGRIANQ